MVDFLEKYLIIESVDSQIVDAIKNNQVLTMHYKGYKGDPVEKNGQVIYKGKAKDMTIAGIRHILPVALGLSKKGNMIVRALVVSKGVHTPHRWRPTKWRTFRIDRIQSVIPREGKNDFIRTAPEGFNPNGDKSMMQIYAIANFDNAKPTTEPQINQQLKTQPTQKPQEPKTKLDSIPNNTKVVLKPDKQEKQPTEKKPLEPMNKEKPEVSKSVQPPKEPEIKPNNEPEEDEGLLGLSEQLKRINNFKKILL